jgi:hypothetical protein
LTAPLFFKSVILYLVLLLIAIIILFKANAAG